MSKIKEKGLRVGKVKDCVSELGKQQREKEQVCEPANNTERKETSVCIVKIKKAQNRKKK